MTDTAPQFAPTVPMTLAELDGRVPPRREQPPRRSSFAPAPPPALAAARTPEWTPAGRAAPGDGNYLLRHWRGDLPLGLSYWVNTVLVGALLPLVGRALLSQRFDDGSGSLRATSAMMLAVAATGVAVQVWSVVGTVRSAARHPRRGGNVVLAVLAMLLAAGAFVNTVREVTESWLNGQAQELFELARGHDRLPPVDVQVAADGRSLLLLGPLGSGSAERVDAALARAPGVRLVHLSSPGGRVYEAARIAEAIRRRGLDTYVDGLCASACTVALMAGRDRGATPNARIGFHRASFAGVDVLQGDPLAAVYREAGASPAFLARVASTSSRDIWYPTPRELVDNHVITRTSLGGETSYDLAIAGIRTPADLRAALQKSPMWRNAERRLPGTIERAVAAGWDAHRRGANDGEVFAAIRGVSAALLPRALATAGDDQLDAFVHLFLDETRATLAISPQACADFLDGRLDGRLVLPPALARRDIDFMAGLFASPAMAPRPVGQAALGAALRPALRRLTPAQVQMVAHPERHPGQPAGRCDAALALYEAIDTLPDAPRHVALRGILTQR